MITLSFCSDICIQATVSHCYEQDLVEVLSDPKLWYTPRKVDQAAFERKADGSFAGYERTPPFEYHDGYLTVHFAVNNYLEKDDLTPLQQEAIWCVVVTKRL